MTKKERALLKKAGVIKVAHKQYNQGIAYNGEILYLHFKDITLAVKSFPIKSYKSGLSVSVFENED